MEDHESNSKVLTGGLGSMPIYRPQARLLDVIYRRKNVDDLGLGSSFGVDSNGGGKICRDGGSCHNTA